MSLLLRLEYLLAWIHTFSLIQPLQRWFCCTISRLLIKILNLSPSHLNPLRILLKTRFSDLLLLQVIINAYSLALSWTHRCNTSHGVSCDGVLLLCLQIVGGIIIRLIIYVFIWFTHGGLGGVCNLALALYFGSFFDWDGLRKDLDLLFRFLGGKRRFWGVINWVLGVCWSSVSSCKGASTFYSTVYWIKCLFRAALNWLTLRWSWIHIRLTGHAWLILNRILIGRATIFFNILQLILVKFMNVCDLSL